MTEIESFPELREEGILVQDLGGEVLIYDLVRHRAHGLNPVAALTWKHCDGKTSLSGLAKIIRREHDLPVDTELVALIVGRLEKAHLLKDSRKWKGKVSYSRREFVEKLKKLGLAASVLLPVVSSIASPRSVDAMSCVPNNGCAGIPNCTPCENPGGQCNGKFVCCNGNCLPPGLAKKICGC